MKYGDIELLLKARFIKNRPENKDKVYDPESPR